MYEAKRGAKRVGVGGGIPLPNYLTFFFLDKTVEIV